jgi:hypothetical protein
MVSRRWLSLGCVALGLSLAASRASAQLAPTGGHYGGRPSDTGFHGGVSSSGGYQAAVPLELPGARGGLPVPVQVVYIERAVGAAGLGWDVPLSFVRVDTTLARRRPKGNPGAAPQAPEQVAVHLEGRRIDLVRTATAWAARHRPDLEVRQQADGSWLLFDGQGRTYQFTRPSPALAGTGMWLLTDVTGVGGSKVHLDYAIATPAIPGGAAISVDLTAVSYNPSPTVAGCFKDSVQLTYDAPAATALARWMLGGKVFERRRKLIAIGVSSKPTCGGLPDWPDRIGSTGVAPCGSRSRSGPQRQSGPVTGERRTNGRSLHRKAPAAVVSAPFDLDLGTIERVGLGDPRRWLLDDALVTTVAAPARHRRSLISRIRGASALSVDLPSHRDYCAMLLPSRSVPDIY